MYINHTKSLERDQIVSKVGRVTVLHNPSRRYSSKSRTTTSSQHIRKMVRLGGLAFLCSIYRLLTLASAQDESRPVSRELFDSLEELSRLVDISYCVGTTGVQEPFQCLSHCAEFPNLELVTVRAHFRG